MAGSLLQGCGHRWSAQQGEGAKSGPPAAEGQKPGMTTQGGTFCSVVFVPESQHPCVNPKNIMAKALLRGAEGDGESGSVSQIWVEGGRDLGCCQQTEIGGSVRALPWPWRLEHFPLPPFILNGRLGGVSSGIISVNEQLGPVHAALWVCSHGVTFGLLLPSKNHRGTMLSHGRRPWMWSLNPAQTPVRLFGNFCLRSGAIIGLFCG